MSSFCFSLLNCLYPQVLLPLLFQFFAHPNWRRVNEGVHGAWLLAEAKTWQCVRSFAGLAPIIFFHIANLLFMAEKK